MKINIKATDHRIDYSTRLAGGMGLAAAKQTLEQQLRRIILANLLWEDVAYASGKDLVDTIKTLVSKIDPKIVANLAIEARLEQKLRHVPLLLARELARNGNLSSQLLTQIIKRPDELTEFLALYYQDGKCPLAKQVKKGLAQACKNFDAYQLGKYKGLDDKIKLRDVFRLVHPKPDNQEQADIWGQLINGTLAAPDTWEVALSSGKDKKETFTRLIEERRLGALAFLRNLRGMIDAGVNDKTILHGFKTISPQWILPVNGMVAAQHAPQFTGEIEDLLFRCLEKQPKLLGKTIIVVDVSGSMNSRLSMKNTSSRLDIAAALAFLARELCERAVIYATAGSDSHSIHATKRIPNLRGFGLAENIKADRLGGGGIFTRQALEYIKIKEIDATRILVISDSQDCDRVNKVPKPFGTFNYLMDISSEKHGVGFDGIWTAEITGWSEKVFNFITAMEQNTNSNI